jgi:cytochrome c553
MRHTLAILGMIAITPSLFAQDGADFFEKKIRPVLVEHCYGCHSRQAGKERGGLLLDSREALRRGGDNGPAIVPGKPDESLLVKAVRQTDPKFKMPKMSKLPAHAIADLEHWVTIGAPDPRDEKAVAKGMDFKAARKHWAYQPVRRQAEPAVKNRAWVKSPIDAFVLAKLEDKGLAPSPGADARTLLRRVYFDLIGLPPTFAEVEEFGKAWDAPGAKRGEVWAAVVDRLLASPHYGERWARHWLDVARYADTKDGVLMFGDDRVRPYAYTYRDYVIRAFNDDTPFDRFVHEQLAADQLKVEPWRLAALGFLTLGRMYDNNIHDVIDDRIDTVTRGLLGLTVSCARCHDHKYDAVPTADYYSLYGVFANAEAPLELPLADEPENCKGLAAYEEKIAPHREKLQKLVDGQYALLIEAARQRVGDYLLQAATTEPDLAETAIYFLSLAPSDLRPPTVNRWRKYLDQPRDEDPIFAPWRQLMSIPDTQYERQAAQVIEAWRPKLHQRVRDALLDAKPKSKADVARAYGKLLKDVYVRSKGQRPDGADQPLFDVVAGKDSPGFFPKAQSWLYMSRGEKDQFGAMRTAIDKAALKLPDNPPRAMVLYDAADIAEPRIFRRGSPASPGQHVPRQFLRVLASEKRTPFTHGSGRLDLAHAITSAENPLTARVFVNRVWMHHFGEPLVSTPSDFGSRSTPPSHPELLDWLAHTFAGPGAEGGFAWSMKKLHRAIVLSAAYQQASFDRPDARKLDPENRLYWRANRQRLDLEAMRDSLLAVSGKLDRTLGGRPVDIANDAKNARRTVYGLVDRQSLPGLFRSFDFASPDQTVERRPMTTVPQQALFGLNAPFMIEQAKALSARTAKSAGEARVQELYRLVYQRQATAVEVRAGLQFVEAPASAEKSQLTAWEQYAQVLLLTNEAMFVD